MNLSLCSNFNLSELSCSFKLLKTLIITHSNITCFPNFNSIFLIEKLDLSFNIIKSMGSFKFLPKLKHLILVKNDIVAFKSLRSSINNTIATVDLRGNPVTSLPRYRDFVVSHFNAIEKLDDVCLSKGQLSLKELRNDLMFASARGQSLLLRPLSMRTRFGYGHSSFETCFSFFGRNLISEMPYQSIRILELDACGITNLEVLPQNLPNLICASFRDNFLTDIRPLEQLINIQELCVSGNFIADVECIIHLKNLVKLDLSNNAIERIEWGMGLENLIFLAVDNNRIKTLSPFSKNRGLVELCKKR